jgi:hypothetical protein
MVFNGTKWDLRLKDDPINDLIETNGGYLKDSFYDIIENLDKRTKTRFEKFLNRKDKDDVKNKLKQEIKLLLYNHRDIPMKLIKNNDTLLIANI